MELYRNLKQVAVEGGKIYLKGKGTNWRVVHPIKVDGEINWKNLLLGGSWGNVIKVAIIVGIILFIAWSYKQDMANCIQYTLDNYCKLGAK